MFKNARSTVLGLVLLVLFFLQFFIKLEWTWLASLQNEEMYKRWSGLALALLITFQWLLTLTRTIKRFRIYSVKMTAVHKWLGAISPLVFYVHSIGVGYGYLALLTYLFFANALLGYLNLDVIKNSSDVLFKGWMIAHVSLSVIITIIMFFHIGVVFYYK